MIANLTQILPLLKTKTIENIFFKKYLRKFSSSDIDQKIHALNIEISAQIDCLQCANCCKKLEPGLEPHEIEILASFKKQEIEVFKQNYIAYDGQSLYLKTKPCLFLTNCSCSIYENRPAACSGYPHLDTTDLKHRKSFWENYSICPIVFNVIEQLKADLKFIETKQ